MSYTTVATVKARLGQYETLITSGMEESEVEAFINEAKDTVDGYIAAEVSLPFTTVPKLISAIATDIAVRNLWAQKQAKQLPEHVKLDYDNAIKNLLAIGKGTLKLSAADAESETFFDLKYSAAARTFRGAL